MKRQGRVWIRIFPERGNSKPVEVRMGKGKGSVELLGHARSSPRAVSSDRRRERGHRARGAAIAAMNLDIQARTVVREDW